MPGLLLVLLLCQLAAGDRVADCSTEPACLKCGPHGCTKCPTLIVHSSRRCVSVCPFGHRPQWSTLADYMGRICVPTAAPFGLPAPAATVLVGVLFGTILSLILVAAALIYLRRRRLRHPLTTHSDTNSDLDDSPERRDFLKQLDTLRPYAHTYLDMLNDTRRQMRQLHTDGDHGALVAYKPVVRDLAKILLLLNRTVDKIVVPDDWEHLFGWAEKALRRYKRMSDVSQPQVTQLIDFLQAPVLSTDRGEILGSTTLSTFKPEQVFGSSLSLQQAVFGHLGNYEQGLNPQWRFEYSLVNTRSEFDPAAWKNSKEYLNGGSVFLDDDFCQLGFRPQDEITTEL